MKTYETVLILNDRKVQDEGKDFVEEFSSKISGAGGEVLRKTPLGKKQFARPIKKLKTGFYWDLVFNWNEQKIRTLPDDYRLDERVLRLRVFVYDRPEDPSVEIAPEQIPVEETVVEEIAAKETPLEETVEKETPLEETATEESPSSKKPAEEAQKIQPEDPENSESGEVIE